MTFLSVNINKIALLRNSRGRNFPDVNAFAARCLQLGAHGITLHPRQDQRHARYSDVHELQALCRERGAELNVEGYPSEEFLDVVCSARPAQCTLVPDAPGQLTSDHGWDMLGDAALLRATLARLRDHGIRTSLFVDYDNAALAEARVLGADRIELYTEPYAANVGSAAVDPILAGYRAAIARAAAAGLGVNAGHDLNLDNLEQFLALGGIDEVSIGHALIVECIEAGIEQVVGRYVAIANAAPGLAPDLARAGA
jgi:pyridoxine 5-phosphate synthase